MEEKEQSQRPILSMPVAIIIAGVIIAGAVYLRDPGGGSLAAVNQFQGEKKEAKVDPVSTSDHILGNPNAKIVIVEYSDPECPFCKVFHDTLHAIIEAYGASGDVAWVYRHFPIANLHPKAPKEAEALECASEQGGNEMFWKYTDAIYATTTSNNAVDDGIYNTPKAPLTGPDGKPLYTQKAPRSATDAGQLSDIAQSLGLDVARFESCLQSGKYTARVTTDTNEAIAAGGQGTPHSILLVGGDQIPLEGAQPLETIKGLIDSLL